MTSQENKGFEQWSKQLGSNGEDQASLKKIWDLSGSYRAQYQPDVEKGLGNLKARIDSSEKNKGKLVSLGAFPKILRMAAALVVIVGAGLLVRNAANGPGAFEEMTTTVGDQKNMLLSDGSQVTLNEASRLVFPQEFSRGERRVSLEGEAFFDVAKDQNTPFVVETQFVEIQVLGTSFNVRAFGQENTVEIFVKTGKVAVKAKNAPEKVILQPGEKLVVDKNSSRFIRSVADSENALAWKDGTLFFKEKKFEEIFGEINRQFGVEIIVENEKLLNCRHTLTVEKSRLQEAFQALGISCPVTFEKISAQKFKVFGTCCQ